MILVKIITTIIIIGLTEPVRNDSIGTIPAPAISPDSVIVTMIAPAPVLRQSLYRFDLNEDDYLQIPVIELVNDSIKIDTLTLLQKSRQGNITVNTERLVYQPNINYSGLDSVELVIGDITRLDTAKIIFNTLPMNDPPHFSVDRISSNTPEDQPLFLARQELELLVADPDSDKLNFQVFTDKYFTIDSTTAGWELLPLADWFGRDSIIVIVSDKQAADTIAIIVEVLSVNDPPVFTTAEFDSSTAEDNILLLPFTLLRQFVRDVDNADSTLLFYITPTSHCRISYNATGILILPEFNWHGTDTLSLSVSDSLLSATLKINLVITPVNDPPEFTATLPAVSLYEDITTRINYSAWFPCIYDPDNQTSEIEWRVWSDKFLAVSTQTGHVNIRGMNNWFGSDTLTVLACDSQYCATTHLSITVKPINDAPVILPLPPFSCPEDCTITINLDDFVYDIDNDKSELSWRGRLLALEPNDVHWELWNTMIRPGGLIHSFPTAEEQYISAQQSIAWISIDNELRRATVASTPDFNSQLISFVLEVTDPGERQSRAILEMSFTPVNDPPVFTGPEIITLDEDQPLLMTMTDWYAKVTDVDNSGNEMEWQFISGKHVNIEKNPAYVVFQPADNWSGNDTIIISIDDGEYKIRDTLEIEVKSANDPPAQFNLVGHEITDSTLTLSWYPSYDIDNTDLEYLAVIEGGCWDTTIATLNNSIQFNLGYIQSDEAEVEFSWYVLVTDGIDTTRSIEIKKLTTPRKYTRHKLLANYPNPFNAYTTIPFELAFSAPVTVSVYDIHGRKIVTLLNEFMTVGQHTVTWDGSDSYHQVASGIYIIELRIEKFRDIRKVMLIK